MKLQLTTFQWVVIILGVLIGIPLWYVLFWAPASSSTVSTLRDALTIESTTPKLGDTVTIGNWSIQAFWTDRREELSAFEKPVGVYYLVALHVQNTGRQNYSLYKNDFRLVTDDGVRYEPKYLLSDQVSWEYGWQDLGKQFPPGIAFNTVLVFDINPAAQNTRLDLFGSRQVILLEN